MAETTPEQGAQPVAFRIVPPSETGDAPVLYANFFQASFSPEDMTFHFGWYAFPPLTEPPTEAVEIEVRPVAKVSVPLNLVRGIISVLQSQVDGWETAFHKPIQEHPFPTHPTKEEPE